MGNLTVKQIDNAKPKDKPYKLMDGDGLQLRVAVDGIKTWLVRYMFDGKERQYVFALLAALRNSIKTAFSCNWLPMTPFYTTLSIKTIKIGSSTV